MYGANSIDGVIRIAPSFSPRTGLFYVPSWIDTYSTFTKRPVEYKEGQRFTGALPAMPIRILQPSPVINRRRPEDGHGAIQAIDPKTGDKTWEFTMTDVIDAGVLTTASDVLFSGGREGYVFALDAKSGALLWRANVGGQVSNGPISYAIGGRQYVAIAAGSSLFVYALRQ
jgi:alcohol dehydrogenase (cytochrome c)